MFLGESPRHHGGGFCLRQYFGSVPRAYIECLRDKAVSIELQRLMQADLPCRFVRTLDCDHSPFYSAPTDLVEVLCQLADGFERPETQG